MSKSSLKSLLRFWPQLLATLFALSVGFFAFRGHYHSKIRTDEDLEAFISETYLGDVEEENGIEEAVESDYFNLAN